ncbi:MAG: hypothetical protein COA84_06520 [Robiginitomaculum sp.]|nr:MAG: hypothetical protein COA84_06520 [Robiginitomaculum sp.]
MLIRGLMILLLAALGAGYLNTKLSANAGTEEHQEAYADAGSIAAQHNEAFAARDIDAAMSAYAPDAVLVLPEGIFSGAESIREQMLKAFENGNQDEAPFVVSGSQTADSLVYTNWTWTMADGTVLNGSDTFIIEHGKVAKQTVSYTVIPSAPVEDMSEDMVGDMPEGMDEMPADDMMDSADSTDS